MTQASARSADEINLADQEIFLRGEAHDLFRILRRERPVHWSAPAASALSGFWSITKLDDVVQISRNPELFISGHGITMQSPQGSTQIQNNPILSGRMMISTDPPDHVRLRRLVNKGFTPRAVRSLEPHIREITTGIIDDVAARGSCDFVTDVAAQLPLAVICELMGIDRQYWQLMFELTNRVLGSSDAEYQTEGDTVGTIEAARATAMQGWGRMFEHFMNMIEERKAQPRQDLVGILVNADIDGEQLSLGDILQFCALLVIAGNETTRNAISGGMLALAQHPEEKQRLIDHPELIDTAVEEILRWTSPVAHMARVATRDIEIRGQRIREGERVVMWYGSVNRDEDYFEDPYRFDITRSPNDHLAFGIGEHFCLGAGFARLEIKVMFQELLRRLPDITTAGPPELLRSNFIAGIKHLPVEYTPER
ncbi:MAG: cytochrome P450 [Chloroflexi bacterium]|nr:cytochrome P450 [Chloroflexota bacterium]